MARKNPKLGANPNNTKNPKYNSFDQGGKSAKSKFDPDGFLDLFPSWSFSSMRFSGPYGWDKCDSGTLLETILPKIQQFESMQWKEIISNPQHHFISLDKICKKAVRCLEETNQDDVGQVFSLRLQGKPRLFGILRNGVFHSLWYDPDHKICKSYKKGQKKSHQR